jgi:hypothetical protein
MYMLYGTAGTQIYLVQTYGLATRIEQRAVLIDNNRREFERQCVGSVWSAWRELPTFAYVPNSMTLIVDGENGDDSTAKGTEALPYKTIQAALNAVPRVCSGDVTVRVKAGTYTATEPLTLQRGALLTSFAVRAYSSSNDVVIEADFATEKNAVFSVNTCSGRVTFSYLNIIGLTPANTGACIFLESCGSASIDHCSFSGARNSSINSGIPGGSAVSLLYTNAYAMFNTYENCVNAIKVQECIVGGYSNTTVSDIDYGIYALMGFFCRNGGNTATGSISDTRTTAGQVL